MIIQEQENLNNSQDINAQGAVNMIGAAIEHCFNIVKQPNMSKRYFFSVYIPQIIRIRKKFLESKVVSMWCDCTDNFEQENLVKDYLNFITDLYPHCKYLVDKNI